jgi:hypothetical protein
MADKLEEIYSAFAAAMDEYNQAVEGMNAAITVLKVAERKFSKAFDDFTIYIGTAAPYDAEPDKHGSDPFSLFKTFTSGGSLFDFGNWF